MKMFKLLGIAVGFAAALTLTSCQKAAAPAAEQKEQVVRVSVETTKLSTFREVGIYYGKLAGAQNATLVSVLGGRVDAVSTKEGALVSAGQSLGRINAEKAQTSRDVAALNEKIAKENWDRQKQFLKDGNSSPITVDQSQLAWLSAKNSLIDAQRALDGALCITPISGVVTRRYVEPFQELAPGAPTFAVSNIQTMTVTIGVPEPEIVGVSLGNSADVTVATLPGSVWKGKVTRLSREVSSDTLSFVAEVTIENPQGQLLPGTSATVALHRRDLVDQIVVSSEAVLTGSHDTFVMVERGGVAHKVLVTTGPSSKTETVITKGLTVGERVIVAGNNLAADGMPVVVTEKEPS